MTRDDIIRMAREAGAQGHHNPDCWDVFLMQPENLERFAALVAAVERKECCRIVTGLCISDNNSTEINKAIRARGQE
jgi:hypothetical protein